MISRAMQLSISFVLAALFQVALADTTTPIDLSGIVFDANGNGLPGVTITIKDMGFSATSDAQGAWSISNGVSATKDIPTDRNSYFEIYGQYLQLNLIQAGQVQVDIIDLMGRQSKTLLKESIGNGQYNVNLAAANVSKGVWLVRVKTAGETHVLRWVNYDGNNHTSKLASTVHTHQPILSKSIGDPDSLIITYNSHEVARLEQANLVAGALPDFIVCTVKPVVTPKTAGIVLDSLPLYVLLGDSFTVHFSFDPALWNSAKLSVGADSISSGDSVYTIALRAPTDTVKLTLATRVQTLAFKNIGNKSFEIGKFAVGATASSGLPVTLNSTTTDICYAYGDSIVVSALGTCRITAIQSGSDQFNTVEVDTSLQVTVGAQTMTFDSLPDHIYGDPNIALNATVTSGLPITYFATTTKCSIHDYLLSLDSAGTCIVKAVQSTTVNYVPATITRSFQIAKGMQTISFTPVPTRTYGDASFAVSAQASSGLATTLYSITKSVCTVSVTSVTIVTGGNCILQAAQSGNANYNGLLAYDTLVIAKKAQVVTITPIDQMAFSTTPFTPKDTAESGLPVVISSATPNVCTVSANAVTTVTSGRCKLVATQAGDEKYLSAISDTAAFNVIQATQTVNFTPSTLSDVTNGVANIPFTVSATSGLPVTISVSDPTVCSVDVSGSITIKAPGTCELLGDQAGDGRYTAAAQALLSFTVLPTP